MLRSVANGSFIDEVYTDSSGYISFANLKYGTYQIYADHPFVSTKTDSVPVLTLDAANPSYSNLSFLLHSTYLELDLSTSLPIEVVEPSLKVYSNPFVGETQVALEGIFDEEISVKVFDLQGRVQESWQAKTAGFGSWEHTLGADWNAGIYFLEIETESHTWVRKLVKRE